VTTFQGICLEFVIHPAILGGGKNDESSTFLVVCSVSSFTWRGYKNGWAHNYS